MREITAQRLTYTVDVSLTLNPISDHLATSTYLITAPNMILPGNAKPTLHGKGEGMGRGGLQRSELHTCVNHPKL